MGVYEKKNLIHIGQVETGFDTFTTKKLRVPRFERLKYDKIPEECTIDR